MNDQEPSARLLRQAQAMAWVGVVVLGFASVVLIVHGQVLAFFLTLTGWGLTFVSALRIGRLRRRYG